MTWLLIVYLLIPAVGSKPAEWAREIRGEYQTDEECSAAAKVERQKDLPAGVDDRMIACVDKDSLKP